jgi:hypothetical protein
MALLRSLEESNIDYLDEHFQEQGRLFSPSSKIPEHIRKPWNKQVLSFHFHPLWTENLRVWDLCRIVAIENELGMGAPKPNGRPNDIRYAPRNIYLKLYGFKIWTELYEPNEEPEVLPRMLVKMNSLRPSVAQADKPGLVNFSHPTILEASDTGTNIEPAKIGYWYSTSEQNAILRGSRNFTIFTIKTSVPAMGYAYVKWRLVDFHFPPWPRPKNYLEENLEQSADSEEDEPFEHIGSEISDYSDSVNSPTHEDE